MCLGAAIAPYSENLATECVRVGLYYGRGCSDISALLDYESGDSHSRRGQAVAASRLNLVMDIQDLYSVQLPRCLRESRPAYQDRLTSFVEFFRMVKHELKANTTLLQSWEFDGVCENDKFN